MQNYTMRDDISIAFSRSNYATPYNDQSIPGSKPGHRLRRLGRQHQPDEVLYNHLSHALIAYGDPTARSTTDAPPMPPSLNFILNTKHGGKRHFDEPRCPTMQPWVPSKRVLLPLRQEDRIFIPDCKARGIYNLEDRYRHPDADDALRQRERQAARQQMGRALVPKPFDHSPVDLGMWYVATSDPLAGMPQMKNADLFSGEHGLSPEHRSISSTPSTQERTPVEKRTPQQSSIRFAAAACPPTWSENQALASDGNGTAAADPPLYAEDAAATTTSEGNVWMASYGMSSAPRYRPVRLNLRRSSDSDVPDYQYEQMVLRSLRESRRTASQDNIRMEDILAVQSLPEL